MNDKEFNLQILAALVEYANELIAAGRITVKEGGQYSALNIERKRTTWANTCTLTCQNKTSLRRYK